MKPVRICLLCLWTCIGYVYASPLTIVYRDHVETFSDAQLQALPQAGLRTATQWNPKEIDFQGPLLSTILKLRHASTVTVVASNGYVSALPLTDIERYQPILAISGNGQRLTIKEKGPYMTLFPYSQYSELRRSSRENLYVWYVKKIIVR
ncbi:hypothetical protein [Chitinivorax sp. B]|uniref:hypothetical protein n=1 Tax=Chitinivorax sp. B TaxID=2502235 RepID=UPI0010F4FE45|nr:hypothetical protein [Chitinivorax sp. B]